MAQRVTEYIEVESGRLRCARCRADFCASLENYKLWVLQQQSPISEVPRVDDPAPHGLDTTLELRRYYCPQCVVQLGAEVARPGDEPLWDVHLFASEAS